MRRELCLETMEFKKKMAFVEMMAHATAVVVVGEREGGEQQAGEISGTKGRERQAGGKESLRRLYILFGSSLMSGRGEDMQRYVCLAQAVKKYLVFDVASCLILCM